MSEKTLTPGVPSAALDAVTDDEIQAAKARRERMLRSIDLGGRLSGSERDLRFAITREESARLEIARLEVVRRRQKGEERTTTTMLVHEQRANLADALRAQGRLDEALQTAPSPALKREIRAFKAAVDRPDDEVCDCEDTVDHDGIAGNFVNPHYIADRAITTSRHPKAYPLTCRICGHQNVTPILPGALSKQMAARRDPLLAPENVGRDSDARVLGCALVTT